MLLIPSKDIELAIEKLSEEKSQGLDCFSGKFYSTHEEQVEPFLFFLKSSKMWNAKEHFSLQVRRPARP